MMSTRETTTQLSQIQCVITDVDGVLSDGYLYLANDGNEFKSFHVHDGMGLKLLMCAGIHVSVITTSKNHIIDKRMQQLGIHHFHSGVVNKNKAYLDIKTQFKVSDAQCLYIGDDLPDLDVIRQVGFSACPSDAVDEVKAQVDFISTRPGGHGAVRQVCNMLLDAKDKLSLALEHYLNE